MLAKPNTYEDSHLLCDHITGRERMSCLTCDFQSKQTTKNEIKPNTNSYLCTLEKRQASVSMFMWKGKKDALSPYSLHIFLLFTKKNSISLRAT